MKLDSHSEPLHGRSPDCTLPLHSSSPAIRNDDLRVTTMSGETIVSHIVQETFWPSNGV
jgi:hypothetical protein